MKKNPFTPTFGSVPPELAGRQQLINDILLGLDNKPGDPNRASIFVGSRGTGKTVLLTAIANQAESMGWISVNVTARNGMLAEILVQALNKGAHILKPKDISHYTGIQIGELGITREFSEQQSTWRSEMTSIVQELNENGVGLLITVDEANSKLEDMRVIVDVYQHFVREGREAALLIAGLPHNVSLILEDDSISFLRRAFRHSMEAISTNEVAQAMQVTIEGAGRTIEPDALKLASEQAGGFAFLIQLIGYHLWRIHPDNERITLEDAKVGIMFARNDMERMVIEPTLRDLSRREYEYLQAMAQDISISNVSDIAERMGLDANNASKVRRRLVERGIIGARGRGRVAFDVPMIREYFMEQS